MSSDPTHFTIDLPITAEQAEEAQGLLTRYSDWVSLKVSGEDSPASPDDLSFFERIYNDEFEDWTGIEVINRRGLIQLSDEAGEPSVQLAGDFVSAIMDRFDVDGAIDFHWSGSGAGHAAISRHSITWPGNEVQVTRDEEYRATMGQ